MKKLLGKIILFLLVIAVLCVCVIGVSVVVPPLEQVIGTLTCSNDYDASEELGKIEEIDKVKYSKGYKKLIVDDSVCATMFKRLQDKNDVYLFAGTNRAFSFPGFYIQIKEFLDNNPDAEEVYVFVGKDTWETTLDAQYGYHCLILPLVYTDTYKYLDENTKEYCDKAYPGLLLNKTFVDAYMKSSLIRKLTLNLLLEYHSKILGEDVSVPFVKTDNEVSPLAYQYFNDILKLCNERGVAVHFIHDPSEYNSERIEAYNRECEMLREVEDDSNRDIIELYLNSILYYPAEDFIDDVHFKGDKDLNDSVIRDMQRVTGLLQDINL